MLFQSGFGLSTWTALMLLQTRTFWTFWTFYASNFVEKHIFSPGLMRSEWRTGPHRVLTQTPGVDRSFSPHSLTFYTCSFVLLCFSAKQKWVHCQGKRSSPQVLSCNIHRETETELSEPQEDLIRLKVEGF